MIADSPRNLERSNLREYAARGSLTYSHGFRIVRVRSVLYHTWLVCHHLLMVFDAAGSTAINNSHPSNCRLSATNLPHPAANHWLPGSSGEAGTSGQPRRAQRSRR
jgi:hypothetical protein